MPELTDQLRRYADAASATADEVDLQQVQSGTRSRRPPLVLAAAAVVLAVVVTAVVVSPWSDDPKVVTTDPTTPMSTEASTSTSDPAPSTTIAEQSTFRVFPVVALAGSEYLVWSGEAGSESAIRADGFAVDVGSGAVREIPEAPIVARSGATGVWSGTELIVCCGTGRADGYGRDTRSAAAWNPSTGDWRTLAAPPASLARSYPTAVWTGDRMVVVATGPAAAEYDPATDTWTELTPPPIRGREPVAAWTGDEVVVWDPVSGAARNPPAADVEDRGWRRAPGDDGWTELPPLPEGSRIRLGSMAWTGGEVVVWGQSTADDAIAVGARWRPGDRSWRPMAASPQGPVPDPYEGTPGSQAAVATSDGRVVVRGIEGGLIAGDAPNDPLYLYDPGEDRWATTGLAVDGYHPMLLVAGQIVLIPDRARPIVGALPPP